MTPQIETMIEVKLSDPNLSKALAKFHEKYNHPAIQLVTVYLVERGLILTPQQVDCKTNEIKAIPPVLEALAQRGVVFAFDALNTQKNL